MVDVIRGATYLDTVHDQRVKFNAVARREDEPDVVHLEYEGIDETMEVPLSLILEADTYELVDSPR